MHFKEPEGQLARWLEVLSAYDMKIEHRPGRLHRNADGLSRIPCSQCGLLDTAYERTASVFHTSGEIVNMQLEQDSDPDISKIKSWLIDKEKPGSNQINGESHFLRQLIGQWDFLAVENDILVRFNTIPETKTTREQAVVPLKVRKTVLKSMHDNKTSGHLGSKKTYARLRQRYYWPGYKRDVRTYVRGCDKCAKRKGPTKTKQAPMQILRSGYPMERIAIDILGELPVTERGNKYILVVADYFTKWTECFPMPNMEARTVAKILVEDVICRFGVPDKIHSDQGRQFESKVFKGMCELLQIEKKPYYAIPPTVGWNGRAIQ